MAWASSSVLFAGAKKILFHAAAVRDATDSLLVQSAEDIRTERDSSSHYFIQEIKDDPASSMER